MQAEHADCLVWVKCAPIWNVAILILHLTDLAGALRVQYFNTGFIETCCRTGWD